MRMGRPALLALSAITVGSLVLTSPQSATARPAPDPARRSVGWASGGVDPTVRTDAEGATYVVEPADPLDPGPVAVDPSSQGRVETYPAYQLHSFPGAPLKILLDFDGFRLSGTAWNDLGAPVKDLPPWDLSGNGPAYTEDEIGTMYEIWRRVAEDFAPFAVDVTTVDPGFAGIDRSGPRDRYYGTRVVITPDEETRAAVCGTCRGVAYLNSFFSTSEHARRQPAFVFPQAFGQGLALLQGTISHETGHTLGLSHDGQYAGGTTVEYYEGHGPWTPIMGRATSQPISQWSRGSYAGATNTEDDTAILRNQLGLRNDEAGQTFKAAADVPARGTSSYITTPYDKDVYWLHGCSGAFHSVARGAAYPNLDSSSTLQDAAGNLVARNDDPAHVAGDDWADGLSSGFILTLPEPARDYYLTIDGVGLPPDPTSGYDDYGSLGRYELEVEGCGKGLPSRPLALRAAVRGGKAVLRWDKPAVQGGSRVRRYDVRVDGKLRSRYSDTRATVKIGKVGRHVVTVTAFNDLGAGPSTKIRVRRPR